MKSGGWEENTPLPHRQASTDGWSVPNTHRLAPWMVEGAALGALSVLPAAESLAGSGTHSPGPSESHPATQAVTSEAED